MHRIATILSAFAAVVLTVLATSPAAFAAIVEPDGGGAQATRALSPAVHHAGLYGWEIALIVAFGVVAVALAAITVGRVVQAPRRPAVQ